MFILRLWNYLQHVVFEFPEFQEIWKLGLAEFEERWPFFRGKREVKTFTYFGCKIFFFGNGWPVPRFFFGRRWFFLLQIISWRSGYVMSRKRRSCKFFMTLWIPFFFARFCSIQFLNECAAKELLPGFTPRLFFRKMAARMSRLMIFTFVTPVKHKKWVLCSLDFSCLVAIISPDNVLHRW